MNALVMVRSFQMHRRRISLCRNWDMGDTASMRTERRDFIPVLADSDCFRVGIIVGTLVFAGCASTVQVPATQLPKLDSDVMARATVWPTVTTTSGEVLMLEGKIREMQLVHLGGVEPIEPPFRAVIAENELRVMSSRGPRAFLLQGNPILNIEYGDRKAARTYAGIGCIAAAIGFGVATGVAFYEVSTSHGITRDVSALGGGVSAALGLSALITGLWLLNRAPSKPRPAHALSLAPAQLRLELRNGGVAVKF